MGATFQMSMFDVESDEPKGKQQPKATPAKAKQTPKAKKSQRPERMQSEQYFKDGKQHRGLNRSTVTTTDRLQRLLVGLLACCILYMQE